MTVPCKECISLAICVSQKNISCPILMDFLYETRKEEGKLVITPYSHFIEAKKFLPKMQQIEWPGQSVL